MACPPDVVAHALGLGGQGLSATEISRVTGINRRTISDWLRGHPPRTYAMTQAGQVLCRHCGWPSHDFDELPPAYPYLLGMYLGDGCISEHRRGVHRLRVTLDTAYPGIVLECRDAMVAVMPTSRADITATQYNCVVVGSYSRAWPCLFPQHGEGKKHERTIVLTDWQSELVESHPGLLLRGLIHSDGCRSMNTGRGGWRCPRYSFSSLSDDIRAIFRWACDLVGVHTTPAPRTVYVSRKADVARLDEFIGPKA